MLDRINATNDSHISYYKTYNGKVFNEDRYRYPDRDT